MVDQLIQQPDQITPTWLTRVLRRAGVRMDGEVEAIEKDVSSPFASIVCRLDVTYTGDTEAPPRLLLKISLPDAHIPGRGREEIAFYHALGASHDLPIPACYDAVFDDPSGGAHLLLADLSPSHAALAESLPPPAAQSEQAIAALAQIHAHWWGKSAMDGMIAPPDAADLGRAVAAEAGVFAQFVDFFGDRLSSQRRAIFERVLAARPGLHRELLESARLTLCHGDAHAWNFLYPRRADGQAYLLDWERVHWSIGTDDLAFMMGLFWSAERRSRYEESLVRAYHAQLVERGVHDYAWSDCWRDYRRSIIRNLFEPLWWWQYGLPTIHWLTRLEHILCAFEDLDCAAFLADDSS